MSVICMYIGNQDQKIYLDPSKNNQKRCRKTVWFSPNKLNRSNGSVRSWLCPGRTQQFTPDHQWLAGDEIGDGGTADDGEGQRQWSWRRRTRQRKQRWVVVAGIEPKGGSPTLVEGRTGSSNRRHLKAGRWSGSANGGTAKLSGWSSAATG